MGHKTLIIHIYIYIYIIFLGKLMYICYFLEERCQPIGNASYIPSLSFSTTSIFIIFVVFCSANKDLVKIGEQKSHKQSIQIQTQNQTSPTDYGSTFQPANTQNKKILTSLNICKTNITSYHSVLSPVWLGKLCYIILSKLLYVGVIVIYN